MEIKILVWSSRYFIEDCETSEVESWGILSRLSQDNLSCHRIGETGAKSNRGEM